MSAGVTTTAWLYCDCDPYREWEQCVASVYGDTVEEVREQARLKGWLIEPGLDLCPKCRVTTDRQRDPAVEAHYQALEAAKRLERAKETAAIKAAPCSTCGAAAGDLCRSSAGNKVPSWPHCHSPRLRAAGVRP